MITRKSVDIVCSGLLSVLTAGGFAIWVYVAIGSLHAAFDKDSFSAFIDFSWQAFLAVCCFFSFYSFGMAAYHGTKE